MIVALTYLHTVAIIEILYNNIIIMYNNNNYKIIIMVAMPLTL